MRNFENALPIIKDQIETWLKAGIIEPKGFIDQPEAGTPQGGPISPLLCNIALNGFQPVLFNALKHRFGYDIALNTLYIRYADDLLFLGPSLEIVQFAKYNIEYYLGQVNLMLNEKKTRIIQTIDLNDINKPISYPFDFLGFTFKMRLMAKRHINKMIFKRSPGNNFASLRNRLRTIVIPADKRIQRHKASIKAILSKAPSADVVCKEINPRIIGWVNYFKFSDAKMEDLPRKMDLWMNNVLRKWIRKSTKKRGKIESFWKKGTNDWIFQYIDKDKNVHTIVKYSKYHWNLTCYQPIKFGTNPYDVITPN